MHVSIAPERLINILGFDLTNTVLTAFIVVALIIAFAFFVSPKLNFANPGKLQLVFEVAFGYLYDMVCGLMGSKIAKQVIGFLFSLLLFILFSNWFGLLPIVPSIAINHTNEEHVESVVATEAKHEEELSVSKCIETKNCYLTVSGVEQFEEPVHLLRAPTTDLSMTVSFAIMAVLSINLLGFKTLKLGYLKKFINFSNPINFIVGILELLSEFIRIISFSFRLFGNIFAGELLLTVITFLSFGIATLPFLFLEIFVGLIQSFVFFILTAMFMTLAVEQHH